MAKSTVATTNPNMTSRANATERQSAIIVPNQPLNASKLALTISDTSNRNPTQSTNPNDRSLLRTASHTPLLPSARGVRQMRLSEFCNSANTLVAPISRVTTLTVVE